MAFFKKKDEAIEENRSQEVKEEIKNDENISQIKPEHRPEEIIASTPLFVKVERYKDILNNINEIKTLLSGIQNILSVLEEIEQLRLEGINTLRITIQRLEKNVTKLDLGFTKPSDTSIEKVKAELKPKTLEAKEMEDSLMEIYNQLNAMRAEIEKLKVY
jgi:hypothetical protein